MRSFVRAASMALTLLLSAPAAALLPTHALAQATLQATLIDINTASKETLETLKGVGPVRAEAIVKGRPYKGKDDLVQKKIVPQNVYDDIKDKIIARQRP